MDVEGVGMVTKVQSYPNVEKNRIQLDFPLSFGACFFVSNYILFSTIYFLCMRRCLITKELRMSCSYLADKI